jgi:hypothetical protein
MPSSSCKCQSCSDDDDCSLDNYSDDERSYCCDYCKKKEREREHQRERPQCKRCDYCKKKEREHCKKHSSCKKVDKYKNKDKKETSYESEIKYSKDCTKDGKCILITIN